MSKFLILYFVLFNQITLAKDACQETTPWEQLLAVSASCLHKQLSVEGICYLSGPDGYSSLWSIFNPGGSCEASAHFSTRLDESSSHESKNGEINQTWATGHNYVCGFFWKGNGTLLLHASQNKNEMKLSTGRSCSGEDLTRIQSLCSHQPLPITLSSFQGSYNSSSQCVELNFKTAAETNSEKVIVEHSLNGKTFLPVLGGEIPSKYPMGGEYKFSDCDTRQEGINYYRLRQRDFDGKEEIHKVIAVNLNLKEIKTLLYPNPTSSELNVRFDSKGRDFVYIQVFDTAGRMVTREKVVLNKYQQNFKINVNNHASGMYILRILGSDQKELHTGKFIKLK
jgi:hypothetical protein